MCTTLIHFSTKFTHTLTHLHIICIFEILGIHAHSSRLALAWQETLSMPTGNLGDKDGTDFLLFHSIQFVSTLTGRFLSCSA